MPKLIKNLTRSARNLPRTSWSTIAPRHRPRIHPPRHINEAPDRHNPKGGGGGDWPLATFNEIRRPWLQPGAGVLDNCQHSAKFLQ